MDHDHSPQEHQRFSDASTSGSVSIDSNDIVRGQDGKPSASKKTGSATNTSKQAKAINPPSNQPITAHVHESTSTDTATQSSDSPSEAELAAARLICSWTDMFSALIMAEHALDDEIARIKKGGSPDHKKVQERISDARRICFGMKEHVKLWRASLPKHRSDAAMINDCMTWMMTWLSFMKEGEVSTPWTMEDYWSLKEQVVG